MNYAVINSENLVVNVVVWDGVSPWSPPEGCSVIQSDTAGIGSTYNPIEGSFTAPKDQ
ncbi:hypothetical protein UFOVP255_45 [uncultured Caudovirales phage]|uniref:Uncharacterized protein n=1 Tax=uncultured Caudovirales phage TaxID=2100421 RepID=A0A6J5LI74_9CAUD|nr:hypothetical protein UFOVP255_45 [uncultured Caudovirales phage]